MSHFMKVSEAGSLALHVMAYLAGQEREMIPANRAAQRLGVSEAHLAKVLQRLARSGLVRSGRGPKGGFVLKRPPEKINLLEVYEAIEGRLEATDCLFGFPLCDNGACILGGLLTRVDRLAMEYLSQTNLSDLAGVFADPSGNKAG